MPSTSRHRGKHKAQGRAHRRRVRRGRGRTEVAPAEPRVRATPVRRPEHVWSIRETMFVDLDEEFRRTAPSTVRVERTEAAGAD